MGFSSKGSQENAASFTLEHGSAENRLELADLERERGLRHEYAFGCPAKGTVFDHRLEIAQLAQGDGHVFTLPARTFGNLPATARGRT